LADKVPGCCLHEAYEELRLAAGMTVWEKEALGLFRGFLASAGYNIVLRCWYYGGPVRYLLSSSWVRVHIPHVQSYTSSSLMLGQPC
jgi:hypothetical protein